MDYQLQWHNRLARRTYKQYRLSNAKVESSSLSWSTFFVKIILIITKSVKKIG